MAGRDTSSSGFAGWQDELALVERLRQGDEAAFEALITRYHGPLVRLATTFVGDRAVAEEVAQETWIGVLNGLDRFEGRSSLKTWIFRILMNQARSRAVREGRSVAMSALVGPDEEDAGPAVDPSRFQTSGPDIGHWNAPLQAWDEDTPERLVLSREARARIEEAIARLPAQQRQVITLRDIEGWSSEEVCNVLDLSETNQRVLLHRARSKVRRALEEYLSAK